MAVGKKDSKNSKNCVSKFSLPIRTYGITKGIKVTKKINNGKMAKNTLNAMALALLDKAPSKTPMIYISLRS